jgi:alpha-N-acetylglucosamine transferase
MIPKIIHLCWLSDTTYPPKIQKCLDSWKKYLPDYEIMLWDTNRFEIDKHIWVRQAFENKKYAFAADYIRFYALYHYGGIYLDSDVEVIKSFDDLLHLPYFVGLENAGTIEAAVMGAEKGCDWVKCCLDYYENRTFIKPDGSFDIRKLPEIMDEVIKTYKPIEIIHENEISALTPEKMSKSVMVFPNHYFSPKIFDSRQVMIRPETYAIHHYQNSWFSGKALVYYRARSFFIRILSYKFVRSMEKIIFKR